MPRFDDDDEDFTPRKKSDRAVEVEDDDDDDAPKRLARKRDDDDDNAPITKRVIKRGWGAADQIKNSGSAYAQKLQLTEEPQIIKFLEDAPYASFRFHWVERTGQKSFTCIDGATDKGCPLCEIGNRPNARFAFNVALMGKNEDPQIKSYEVGTRVLEQLKIYNKDDRQGPLPKHYWAVSRSGKGTTSATNHQMVKERDLEEEWGIEPLTPADHSSLSRELYDEDIISVPSRKDLLAIASEDD